MLALKKCQLYCEKYHRIFGKTLVCEFKENKSKIQKLISKVHVKVDGRVTEV